MTWTETHERTRILREVEAVATDDMSGAVPWRAEWAPYFAGPAGLVAALQSRWNRMVEAQLDERSGPDEVAETYARLRESHAGTLRILNDPTPPVERLLRITGETRIPAHPRRRGLRLHGGPVLPSVR